MTQREKSYRLAQAFKRHDKAVQELERASRAVDDAFFPWAAGRRVSRDEARQQLASTGILE